jgi:glycine cleavage system aminomethyltransferase T
MAVSEPEKVFVHSPYVPYDPGVALYDVDGWNGGGDAEAWEYTGWRDEVMSWKETAYIHGHLNPSPTYVLRGPDALRFLTDFCVNSFATFAVGASRHAIMCNDAGEIMVHGMLLRVAEDEFITYWLSPWLPYLLMKHGDAYDVQGEDLTGKVFLFQVAGPRSLEVLEAAAGDNLHDIRFLRHRPSRIDGRDVNVIRIGMAGTLAYELHGDLEDALPVYRKVLEAGEAYRIKRLGIRAYMLNHTEDGFPQSYYHFPVAWEEDAGFMAFMAPFGGLAKVGMHLRGSMGTDLKRRYRNPVELGWAHMIKFDHDFPGRAALEKEVAEPSRQMVTLVWNKDDIVDVYRSQFEPGETYLPMDHPNHFGFEVGDSEHRLTLWADEVQNEAGDEIGISSGRAQSHYYREMLSLASVDSAYAELGTEVYVLWGEPGTRQKRIRAVVSRFPYLNENRNEDIDVDTIPVAVQA